MLQHGKQNFIASAEAASVCVRAAVAERKAVIILASQKTLPVAVTVISYLPDDTWQLGILVIPCTYRATSLCYHTNTMPLPPTGIYLYMIRLCVHAPGWSHSFTGAGIVCHLSQLLIDSSFVSRWATMTAPGGTLGLGAKPSTTRATEAP